MSRLSRRNYGNGFPSATVPQAIDETHVLHRRFQENGSISARAALLMVAHHFGRTFAQLKLVAHSLQSSSKSFNLLLLFSYDRSLFLYLMILFFDFAMLFEEFVEQHRVYRVVTHGINLTILVAHHQVRIDRFHVLGNQPKLWNPLRVYPLFVTERNRFERKERFAGVVHCLNLLFKSPRGSRRAKFAVRINENGRSAGRGLAKDTANIATVAYVGSGDVRADTNNVTGRGHVLASAIAQGDVAAAGGVVKERIHAEGRVVGACGGAKERNSSNGRVVAAGGVAKKRTSTVGRVEITRGVALERTSTDGRVSRTGGIEKERCLTVGRVETAPGVAQKRPCAGCRILVCSVEKERPAPMAVLKLPVVLLLSERKPMAVLFVAVVRLRRASCPSAVFPPG